MVDFSDFINSLENIKNGLESAQRKINFDSESADAQKEIASILKKSLDARKKIRNFFFECATDDNQKQEISKALGNFGNGFDDVKRVQDLFELFMSDFLTQTFSSLVCTQEIHEALHELAASQQQEIFEKVEDNWPELAPAVHEQIFIFDDFQNVDDRAVQKILREVDMQEVARALINSHKEVQDKIFSNMTERAGKMLKEEMEYMGPVREQDIMEARDAICRVVRRLVDSGEIVI